MSCPCGLGATIESCCGPLIHGLRPAATPEALMRSRYTAYVVGSIDYIIDTNDPSERNKVDRESTEKWSKESTWQGLEVLGTEGGGPDEDRGTVEFVARFTFEGQEQSHHEVAEFRRRDGRWYYLDGKIHKGETFTRETPKVGRNDPCPCGSNKKYKKCCGAMVA